MYYCWLHVGRGHKARNVVASGSPIMEPGCQLGNHHELKGQNTANKNEVGIEIFSRTSKGEVGPVNTLTST